MAEVVVLPAPKVGDVIYVPYGGSHSWPDGAQLITGGKARVVEAELFDTGDTLLAVENHPVLYLWEVELAPIQEGLKREFGDRWSTSYDWEH